MLQGVGGAALFFPAEKVRDGSSDEALGFGHGSGERVSLKKTLHTVRRVGGCHGEHGSRMAETKRGGNRTLSGGSMRD